MPRTRQQVVIQSSTLDISTALDIAEVTIEQLKTMKKVDKRDELFATILEFAEQNEINCPSAANQRGRQSRAEADRKRQRSEADPLERYNNWYDELLTDFIKHLSEKFNTDNYKPLMIISDMLLNKTKQQSTEYLHNLEIFKDDIQCDELESEMDLWYIYKTKNNLKTMLEIKNKFVEKELSSIFPNLFILLIIFLTVLVTSAQSERSFSVLKRLKTWLRSTIGQVRLSSLAIIQMNLAELSIVNIESVINIFASEKKRRIDFY